jgi:hypothetical protein
VKLTLKLILVLSLFSSVAFADGDMGNGGEGDMGNGGKTCPQNQQTCRPAEPPTTTDDETGSILSLIRTYLGLTLG